MPRGWPPTPAELPNIKNSAAYRKQLQTLPDWRIGCIFTGSRHHGTGVAPRRRSRHPGGGPGRRPLASSGSVPS